MKIFNGIILLFLGVYPIGAQNGVFPSKITMGASSPSSVSSVNVQKVGNTGNSQYYYWVVANYPVGQSSPSPFAKVIASADTLSGSNYNQIFWGLVSGATTYDVLRTTTPFISSPCTCAVSTGLSATTGTVNDQSNSLSSYTLTVAPNATATVTLNNQSFTQSVIYIDTPVNSIKFASLPVASSVKGITFLVVDASALGVCSSGGGTNTPALCWSNGSSYIGINTGGGAPTGPAGGDLSGTYPNPTVVNGSHVTNSSIPNSGLANTVTTVNTVACTLGSSCTVGAGPTGTAGGDLSGSYPNPTVAQVNGGVIPASSALLASNVSRQLIAATLTSAHFYVGNGSNLPVDVAMSGDATLANTGAITVTKANGGSFPTSATVLGTNGSAQPIAATTTGSGTTAVLATSPVLVTPNIGVASGASVALTTSASTPAIISNGTKFTTSGGGCTVTSTFGGAMAGGFTTTTTGTCTTTITFNGATGLTLPIGAACVVNDITSGISGGITNADTHSAILKVATTSGDTVVFACMGF